MEASFAAAMPGKHIEHTQELHNGETPMRNTLTGRSLVLTIAVVLANATIGLAEDKSKAIKPFNGKDLTGWLTKGGSPEETLKVGKAKLDPDDPRELIVEAGGRDLVNFKGGQKDFYTIAKFGDAVIEVEFMVPKGSNSGIYVMGEYEIQIGDKRYPAEALLRAPYDPGGTRMRA